MHSMSTPDHHQCSQSWKKKHIQGVIGLQKKGLLSASHCNGIFHIDQNMKSERSQNFTWYEKITDSGKRGTIDWEGH